MDFIHALENNPRLEDSSLDSYTLHRLRHPLTTAPTITPDERLSIKMFLAETGDGAEKIYNKIWRIVFVTSDICLGNDVRQQGE